MIKFFRYFWLALTRHRYDAGHRIDVPGKHLFDETQAEKGGGWINLHGYLSNDGEYFVAADYRWLGIRIQNVIIKCSNKESYDRWIQTCTTSADSFYEKVTGELPYTRGDVVDTCYSFNTEDGHKEYNIDQSQDVLAEA